MRHKLAGTGQNCGQAIDRVSSANMTSTNLDNLVVHRPNWYRTSLPTQKLSGLIDHQLGLWRHLASCWPAHRAGCRRRIGVRAGRLYLIEMLDTAELT